MSGADFLQSAVYLYHKTSVLDRDVAVLRDAGYRVLQTDALSWASAADMHRDVAEIFRFPAHYGCNWDALNDCLGDVRAFYWNVPEGTLRVVLVLWHFDAFAAKCPDDAHLLLDIFASNQRDALIVGDHLICLAQSDDPSLQLAPVGASAPQWNRDEWLNRNRGL